ncbi:MAG TPA: shikimate dehydrogenase [Bryobacteraceae bacterium]|nr:shikimate dehydrogenase [Bryobacteraceae bacterium]
MPADYKAEIVACFGQPVAENPTGVMQEAGFAAAGLNWRYLTIEVAPGGLKDAVAGARAMGWQGFNLTIPHKVAVMEHLDAIAPEARMIGAVNTVRRDGDRFIGENTDGKGFLRAVRQDAGLDPNGKRIVLLGAGGAARAIAMELGLAGASEIVVVNRDPARGQPMTDDLKRNIPGSVRLEPWSGTFVVPQDVDILVNATSIGLYPDIGAKPNIDLSKAADTLLLCDAVFNPPETQLLKACRERGLRVLDGLSMLVYQGVIGFELWTGRSAPEAVMKQALREALQV